MRRTRRSGTRPEFVLRSALQQARALDEDTVARRRVLSEHHPDTVFSANDLAVDLRALGEPEEA